MVIPEVKSLVQIVERDAITSVSVDPFLLLVVVHSFAYCLLILSQIIDPHHFSLLWMGPSVRRIRQSAPHCLSLFSWNFIRRSLRRLLLDTKSKLQLFLSFLLGNLGDKVYAFFLGNYFQVFAVELYIELTVFPPQNFESILSNNWLQNFVENYGLERIICVGLRFSLGRWRQRLGNGWRLRLKCGGYSSAVLDYN